MANQSTLPVPELRLRDGRQRDRPGRCIEAVAAAVHLVFKLSRWSSRPLICCWVFRAVAIFALPVEHQPRQSGSYVIQSIKLLPVVGDVAASRQGWRTLRCNPSFVSQDRESARSRARGSSGASRACRGICSWRNAKTGSREKPAFLFPNRRLDSRQRNGLLSRCLAPVPLLLQRHCPERKTARQPKQSFLHRVTHCAFCLWMASDCW